MIQISLSDRHRSAHRALIIDNKRLWLFRVAKAVRLDQPITDIFRTMDPLRVESSSAEDKCINANDAAFGEQQRVDIDRKNFVWMRQHEALQCN